MNGINSFFLALAKNPSLIWKAGAAIVFIALGLVFLLSPETVFADMDNLTRFGFGTVLVLYGAFRLSMFVSAYKNRDDEN